jgi:hypothetical protein
MIAPNAHGTKLHAMVRRDPLTRPLERLSEQRAVGGARRPAQAAERPPANLVFMSAKRPSKW